MTFLHFSFYLFATLTVAAAVAVVTVRNPVRAALSLVLAFVSASGVWLTLQAEFLAIVLVLVYVGAVMVLFLFVVMMLDVDLAAMRAGFTRYLPLGAVIVVVLVAELVLVMTSSFTPADFPEPGRFAADYSNTKALGLVIYTDYVFAFEVASLILLVAMIAAIALTHRPGARPGNKAVNPAQQVVVKREDRLRIVSMKSEGGGDA